MSFPILPTSGITGQELALGMEKYGHYPPLVYQQVSHDPDMRGFALMGYAVINSVKYIYNKPSDQLVRADFLEWIKSERGSASARFRDRQDRKALKTSSGSGTNFFR